ncbi:MAG: hypothetical protein ACREQF_04445, partial [Candidatus Binataceae bacterium]
MHWMRMTDVRPMWVLSLVPNVRFGRLLCAALVLALMLGAYTAAGLFTQRSTGGTPPNVAVFFAVILAYIVPTYHYIVARCTDALTDLERRVDVSPEERGALRRSIAERSTVSQLSIVGVGLTAGVLHNVALTYPEGLVRSFFASPAEAAVICGTLLVWIVMTTVVTGLFQIATVFARLATRVRVDLLQPRALTPFARVAVILTLGIVGAQAAFPLLWLDNTLSLTASAPGFIGTAIPMVFLFLMPLLPIHRRIAAAKAAEIARLDVEVAALTCSHGESDGRGFDDVVPLAALLAYRREIDAVHEWPFNMGVASRLAIYLVIPPLTWIATALIQHFV